MVTLNGADHYLGPYRSRVSHLEYDRLISEWIQNGRTGSCPGRDTTVVEVASAYLKHALAYYVKNGKLPVKRK